MLTRRQVLATTGATVFSGITGCLTDFRDAYAGVSGDRRGGWPQPHYDEFNTSYNPATSGPKDGVDVHWKLNLPRRPAPPIVAAGRIIIAAGETIEARNIATGDTVWKLDSSDGVFATTSPLAYGGRLFIPTDDPTGVRAVDIASGATQWEFSEINSPIQEMALREDLPTLVLGTSKGEIVAVDPSTGNSEWKRDVFGSAAHIVFDTHRLLVGTRGGEVFAFSGVNGGELWRRKFPGRIDALGTISGSYGGAGGFVGVGDEIHALTTSATGQTMWTVDSWTTDTFVIAGHHVFAANNELTAVDYHDGKIAWNGPDTARCGPAGADGVCYVATENGLKAISMDGGTGIGPLRTNTTHWTHSLESGTPVSIAIAHGKLIVVTSRTETTAPELYVLEESSR